MTSEDQPAPPGDVRLYVIRGGLDIHQLRRAVLVVLTVTVMVAVGFLGVQAVQSR